MHCGQTGKMVLQSRWGLLPRWRLKKCSSRAQTVPKRDVQRELSDSIWAPQSESLSSPGSPMWDPNGHKFEKLLGNNKFSNLIVTKTNDLCRTVERTPTIDCELEKAMHNYLHWIGMQFFMLVPWSCKCEYKFLNDGLERCWTVGY